MFLAETSGTDTLHYFHTLGLVAESDGTDTDYFATDGLGSVRHLTDDAAGVLLAQTFDPYGSPYANAGAGGRCRRNLKIGEPHKPAHDHSPYGWSDWKPDYSSYGLVW